MKVLVACEESQAVTKEFRALQKQWRCSGDLKIHNQKYTEPERLISGGRELKK